eukprot:scaffold80403_cov15-Tisochrysis_lutea.AAC.1
MSRIGKDACPAASGMAPFLVDQLHWHTFSLAQPNTSCPSAMCTYSLDCGNGKDASWVALECGHVFHMECVAQALEHQRTCPTCRSLAPCYLKFIVDGKSFGHGMLYEITSVPPLLLLNIASQHASCTGTLRAAIMAAAAQLERSPESLQSKGYTLSCLPCSFVQSKD